MNDANLPQAVEPEVAQLRHQLQLRDRLIDQLSTELFRMVKTHPPALPPSSSATSKSSSALALPTTEEVLRTDLKRLEQQIEFYQSQIDKRDLEISRLQKSCQTLSDRNQMLERIIQELPEVYRQKFSDRLDAVKSKFQSLQTENRRLHSELQQQANARSLPESKGTSRKN
ncbi:Npun_F5560 family protein [Altericista sp. CCNU0014]|uniref:Npun_F5560 family protein n=1 Tax=Altericista sp. CCNU0014 TaxID=3082949 RepID=UPI00384D6662